VAYICGGVPYDEDTQFCDTRDKTIYAFEQIGEQIWMTEDLDGTYTWAAATTTACPFGWKLPSKEEWEELIGVDRSFEDGLSTGEWWTATEHTNNSRAYSVAKNDLDLWPYPSKLDLNFVRCIKVD